MNAYGWSPPHDKNGQTAESRARQEQIDIFARAVYPHHVRADAVHKALQGFPQGVPIFNRHGQFLGVTSSPRLLPPTGATLDALKVRKAKGKPPFVACYDPNGALIGVVDPADLVTLGKGESYVHDANGNVNGIMGADKKVRPIATPTAKPAEAAAPTPVAKSSGGRRAWPFGENNAGVVLATLGKRWSKQRVAKGQTVPMSPIEAGLRALRELPPAERRRFAAKLAACTPESRRALAQSAVLKQASPLGAAEVLDALRRLQFQPSRNVGRSN